MTYKVCIGCGLSKNLEDYCFRNIAKNIRQSRCRICTRTSIRKHYKYHTQYYLNKAKQRNMIMRNELRKYVIDYLKSHPCVDCGESDIIVLEFDHIKQKTVDISLMLKNRYSLTKLQSEMSKCVVRCANCHRRRTAKRGNWFRHSMSLYSNDKDVT